MTELFKISDKVERGSVRRGREMERAKRFKDGRKDKVRSVEIKQEAGAGGGAREREIDTYTHTHRHTHTHTHTH